MPSQLLRANATRVLIVCLGALLWGCGASPPRVPAPAELQGLPEVTVSVGPGVTGDRVQAFQAQDGSARLRNAVLDELLETKKGAGLGVAELRISVTRFRLRSTASGVWLGGFAGADMLDVSVAVVNGGQTTRTFGTGVGGLTAGLVKPSAGGRFNGLVRAVAKRIVEKL